MMFCSWVKMIFLMVRKRKMKKSKKILKKVLTNGKMCDRMVTQFEEMKNWN